MEYFIYVKEGILMADTEKLSMARKYRPTSFARYIGNASLKAEILETLKGGKRPQVYMFYGSSGCGKTSIARLLAKEYSCLNRDDEKGACGVCDNCRLIDEYITTGVGDMLANIKELNVAKDSGKRDFDDIFEDMTIPTFGDEWKVYIFDECHKASDGLQNRFLKIVEEPPENILIIFCTTNPEEMLETLRNRVNMPLKVEKPKVKELAGLLRYACECEQSDYDNKGLEFIANRSELTIRTSLQNLERVINSQGNATYESAIKVFEEVSETVIINLFRALKSKDVLRFVTILFEIKSKMELSAFLVELSSFVVRGIYTINGIVLDGIADAELKIYRELFGDLGVQKTAYLLKRIQSIDKRNIELELLMFGYSGLDIPRNNSFEDGVSAITHMSNELKLENKMADKIIEEKEEVAREQGIANASSSMKSVDFDAILEMGGILVED